ncbi:protein of unknown function [Candidatus Nitrosocosmicus franklandus]|uniref:Uncharacterized protein n=1 Tax=Candidatus Nitrosocosmicus franklandianus TaxID=1798806 RepID=A0A484I5Z8_9ARCH|nr:protein of unknown function [Candidatus Nitrosocosmicus franklandus]
MIIILRWTNMDVVTSQIRPGPFLTVGDIGIVVVQWKIFPKNVQILYYWQK